MEWKKSFDKFHCVFLFDLKSSAVDKEDLFKTTFTTRIQFLSPHFCFIHFKYFILCRFVFSANGFWPDAHLTLIMTKTKNNENEV